MLWYNPLQNTIYCGKLVSTTYHYYQGENRLTANKSQRGGRVWSALLSPWI